jgi:hypothetical protein
MPIRPGNAARYPRGLAEPSSPIAAPISAGPAAASHSPKIDGVPG